MLQKYGTSMRDLVSMQDGTISRDIFVSDEIYSQELEQVFARSWLFVGHESQVPNPNDYFVSRMGEESVILTRDKQGKIHVLLNTCRHRGMKVCRYDEGNAPVLSCPYHGWSFSTDGNLVNVPGELIGVPQFQAAYYGELKKEEWGLISPPKVHVYKGSVWACWDAEAPEWDEYMGEMKHFLDAVFDAQDGSPGGRMVFGGVQKWILPCNWKFPAENFIGDGYHGISHRSAQLAGMMPGGRIARTSHSQLGRNMSVSFQQGHGVLSSNNPEDWKTPYAYEEHPNPVVNAYFKKAHEARMKRLGGAGPQRSGGSPSTIFPNMSFGQNMTSYTFAVWHPAGPRRTEAWRWVLVDKDVPEEVRELWLEENITMSGPTGGIETDDMENWNYASDASNGTIARRYPYNYAQGLGHETTHEAFPGSLVSLRNGNQGGFHSSEQNQRGFYRRWAEVMDARSWSELK